MFMGKNRGITAVPRYYRDYRGITAVPITVQLSTWLVIIDHTLVAEDLFQR